MMTFSAPLNSFLLMLILFTLIQLHESIEASDEYYELCKKPLHCGDIYGIKYPFYDDKDRPAYCGYPGFKLSCDDETKLPEIEMTPSVKYYLLSTDPDSSNVTVCREDYWTSLCPADLSNTTINFTTYSFASSYENATLYYECSTPGPTATPKSFQFPCPNLDDSTAYFAIKGLKRSYGYVPPAGECRSNVSVPLQPSLAATIKDQSSLLKALQRGFQLEWIADNQQCYECRGSGGECGYNTTTNKFTCYCPDQPYPQKCPSKNPLTSGYAPLCLFFIPFRAHRFPECNFLNL